VQRKESIDFAARFEYLAAMEQLRPGAFGRSSVPQLAGLSAVLTRISEHYSASELTSALRSDNNDGHLF